MKEHWYFLREFESSDLVMEYIKKQHGYNPSKEKVYEITSSFSQGREFFESASKSDISVRPILQYYGVLSLSRGLILVLTKSARENSIKPSHGLAFLGWDKTFENISVKITNGTFLELIQSTENTSYFRSASSGVNWSISYPIPSIGAVISMGRLAYSFPDLDSQIRAWLGFEAPLVRFSAIKTSENAIDIVLDTMIDNESVKSIFPVDVFDDVKSVIVDGKQHVVIKEDDLPNIAQKWVSCFQTIGDMYIIPPISKDVRLNIVSTQFAVSYILCMISRYYPSVWQKVHRGISNDRIMPFALKILDLISDRYPQVIDDFLKAPYNFK
jgi:hypothetical protein